MLHFMEGPVQGHITEDRSRKKSSTQQELNPQTLYYEARALPLCFTCCPEEPPQDCPPWTLLVALLPIYHLPPLDGFDITQGSIRAKHDKTLAIPIKTEWLRVLRVRDTRF